MSPSLHEICVFKHNPHDSHLVPETEWIMPVRVGTARSPSKPWEAWLLARRWHLRLLFSLSFPNLPISFPPEQQQHKSLSGPEKQFSLPFSPPFLFFFLTPAALLSLAHCVLCANDKRWEVSVLVSTVPCVLEAPFTAPHCLLCWSLWLISSVSGHCIFVFTRVSVLHIYIYTI